MRSFTLTVLLLLVLSANSAPFPGYVLHETRAKHGSLKRSLQRPGLDTVVSVNVALKQGNLDFGREALADISNPFSHSYGRHWTPEAVAKTFASSRQSLREVTHWLRNHITGNVKLSKSGNILSFNATIGQLEDLLKIQYHLYEHGNEELSLSCDSYYLPESVRPHVDFVTPTIDLDRSWKRSVGTRISWWQRIRPVVGPSINHPDFRHLSNCSQQITPACLRALYGIPIGSVNLSSYGVVEFSPVQNYKQSDLDMFYSTYANVPIGTAPRFAAVDGGFYDPSGPNVDPAESDLDMEYAIALTYPQEVTLYQVGDANAGDPATNNNFLDAVDGSYCTYMGGDDHDFDGRYPDVPDYTYPGQNLTGYYNYSQDCGTLSPTHVISISYGSNEGDRSIFYQQRQCDEYMKLGLMEVSIIFSAGDSGVAGIRSQCIGPGGVPVLGRGAFNPMYPSVCPWVTSVGATTIKAGRSIQDREIASTAFPTAGGFSSYFDMPDYQKALVGNYFTQHLPPYNSSVYNNSQTSRGYPDVSFNGQDYVTAINGQFFPISGTSASAPAFGSVITLINEERIKAGKGPVGFLNPALYAHPDAFEDIIEGTNPGCGTGGFTAVQGWDPVTGLGTPRYSKLLKILTQLP